MPSIFCCSNIAPYKNAVLSHEPKFTSFLRWAGYPRESEIDDINMASDPSFAIQLVSQVNYGPLESKRYFAVNDAGDDEKAFVEITEKWLVDANFQKLNTYKNFKCTVHNKFFEVNVYKKDPVNKHP